LGLIKNIFSNITLNIQKLVITARAPIPTAQIIAYE